MSTTDARPLVDSVAGAARATTDYLLGLQSPQGYWVAELLGDTRLEAEYIMLLTYLGRPGDDPKIQALARYLWQERVSGKGWVSFPGGPTELSSTVKAYLALKIAGYSADLPEMQETRRLILDQGGIDACNSFTKYYLAVLGQFPWRSCPAVPPELTLIPPWFYFNIYSLSSWSRCIIVPLTIIFAHKPVVKLPQKARIDELFVGSKRAPLKRSSKPISWRNFWLQVNDLLWLHEKLPFKPLRGRALAFSLNWILERCQQSDGLGAIFPPILNTVMALTCLGYPQDHPYVSDALGQLEALEIAQGDTLRVQPCKSPVWDTSISLISLQEAGLPPEHPALVKAMDWLLGQECTQEGDWKGYTPEASPGGWCFQFANPWYPDNDDTAYVLLGLARMRHTDPEKLRGAIKRGLDWLMHMQNRNGSWSSFDRNNNHWGLETMPFADQNATIDPGAPDITGRVLETLGCYGYNTASPRVRTALDFIYRDQRPDGSWFGRWGCNYIYGTWQVLKGLTAVGVDPSHAAVRQAAEWLRSVQNPDGGWGETLSSYDDDSLMGKGPSTASQTAWALMGLLTANEPVDGPAVERGFAYLVSTQKSDGSWDESCWTGTGFPKVFYLRYFLYQIHFPLFAMGMYLQRQGKLSRPESLGSLR